MSSLDDKVTLEAFDGHDPSANRKWKRRTQLMLAALPNTIPKEKLGPRLMQYIKGEAELVCEAIAVEKLCAEGGDKLVLELLDEKYGPQPTDLLCTALKEFFYELSVKQGEAFQQFQARFFAAEQKLKEQEIVLPEKVLGFMLLKKLKLEPSHEAMVLTATAGSVERKDMVKALKAIFPEGKGVVNSRHRDKDAFFTAVEGQDLDSDDKIQDVLGAVPDLQEQEIDDEAILEAYESYTDIRRRMAERKKQRGFAPQDTAKWRLSGTVSGRLEQLKQRTKCHVCRRPGHWKRECPLLLQKGSRRAARRQERLSFVRSSWRSSSPRRLRGSRALPRMCATAALLILMRLAIANAMGK